MAATAVAAPKTIRVSEVIAKLKSGYTRWESEAFEEGKSIQAVFGLTFSECKELFKHDKIKGLKTKVPTMLIIDDTVEGQESTTVVSNDEEEATPEVQQAPALVEQALTGASPVAEVAVEPVPETSVFD